MGLNLRIENQTSLPDGGPIEITLEGRRGIDIGRDQYLDWVLPDPDRVVSGKHAEVRFRDGGYWLHDVSRNGTFLNRNPQRLQEGHRLADGDRIEIGPYVIAVALSESGPDAGEGPARRVQAAVQPDGYWAPSGEVAPAIAARDLRPPREARPVQPDFIDWAVDVPSPDLSSPGLSSPGLASPQAPGLGVPPQPARPVAAEMDWAAVTPPPLPPAPPPLPTPRRRAAAEFSGPSAASPWDPGAAPEAAPTSDWELPAMPGLPGAPELPGTPDMPRAPDLPGTPGLPSSPAAAARPEPRGAAGLPDGAGPGAPAPFEPRAARPPATAEAAAPARAHPGAADDVMRRFARGLGVPVETIAWREAGDLAEELGGLVRLATENVKQLLAARAEAKRVARTNNQTMIQALDNNPLKFAPTADDALRIMLGRPSAGYLDSRRALETSFRDLKAHQVKTFSAMQNAARLLLDDLAPDAIAEADEGDKGLGGLLGSRKARLWDIYATRWDAVASAQEDGMAGAFTLLFAECYEGGR